MLLWFALALQAPAELSYETVLATETGYSEAASACVAETSRKYVSVEDSALAIAEAVLYICRDQINAAAQATNQRRLFEAIRDRQSPAAVNASRDAVRREFFDNYRAAAAALVIDARLKAAQAAAAK